MMMGSRNAEELIEIALRISSESQKLKLEKQKKGLVVLDMQFYSNYFFTLGRNKWWMMSAEDVNRLADKLMENRKMGHDILDSIQAYRVDDPIKRVSVLEEKMKFWTKKVVEEYSLLLTAKPLPDEESSSSSSQGQISSCKEIDEFITSICCTATKMFGYRKNLKDKEKQEIYVSRANLRFIRGFVRLDEEREGMKSVLNRIQGYTRKVEVGLFLIWVKRRSALEEQKKNPRAPRYTKPRFPKLERRENDSPLTSVWECIIERIFRFTSGYSNELLDYLSGLSLPVVVVDQELQGRFQLLHERLMFMAARFLWNLSFEMQVLFLRAAACLGFFCIFSFLDSSEQMIEHAKFQLSIMTTSLNFSIVELSSIKDNMNQIMFVLHTVTDVAQSDLKLLDSPENADLHSGQDIFDTQLLLAEQTLRKGIRLVRIVITDLKQSGIELVDVLRECLKVTEEDGYLWAEKNVSQILLGLDTGDVAAKLAHFISLSNTDDRTTEEMHLHLRRLIVDLELLEAEQMMLNGFLNHRVDSDIEMLRKGFRLLRIVLTDSPDIEKLRNRFRLRPLRIVLTDSTTMEDSADEITLRVSGDELVKDVIPLLSKLRDNTMETDDFVSDMLPKLISWEADVTSCYLQIRRSSKSTHPRTARLGFIDCLEDTLYSSAMPATPWMKYQIRRALKDLKSCKYSLNGILWDHNEDNELDNLVSRLTQAAYEVEYVSESFAVGHCNTWTIRLWISDHIDEIKQISMTIKDILVNKSYNDDRPSVSGTWDRVLLKPVDNNIQLTNEVVVAMEEQEATVTNQVIRGSTNLGVVSIVGMGGLGKTTLAKKVFNSPLVQQSFEVRSWCTISKVYRKRDILLEILGYVIEVKPEIRQMTDYDLANMLRQLLLRRSYLIVMDDMWDLHAWEEIQDSFPENKTRSRILFTSRINHIASKSGYGLEPCSLNLLSDTQSWELLERKVFEGGTCPSQLRSIGREIATKCKGLPLAIVVVSGLLPAKEINLDRWKQVAKNLNSIVVGNSTNIIDLSYRYLPDHLKPCFLYFGAFKEDEKVLASNLIDLWIAEGFIQKNNNKSINEVARGYLKELVTRNLVNVAERTSMGGIKACHVHDLLHELCRARAEEESFLHVVKTDQDSALKYDHRRVCIYSNWKNLVESRPSGQCVRSLLYFSDTVERFQLPRDFHLNFKLLRTLKLDSINIGNFLGIGFELLIHLRFLAFVCEMMVIPDYIKHLSNLEFFYVKGLCEEIELRDCIWKLKKLRNLQVRKRCSFSSIEESLVELDNLESLSTVFLPCGESTQLILQRLPNLRKLNCIFPQSWNKKAKTNQFPILESLNQLESLKVIYHGNMRHPSVFSFPATLKKLTLSKFCLPWKDISQIGTLPCLEVLKLLSNAFVGQEWEMESEGLFQNLKYLKLQSLDIERWTTSYDSFPCLQKLVLQSCKILEEVPIAFGESTTLQMIQVLWCNNSAAQSVKDIQDEQMDTCRVLNVLIHPSDF